VSIVAVAFASIKYRSKRGDWMAVLVEVDIPILTGIGFRLCQLLNRLVSIQKRGAIVSIVAVAFDSMMNRIKRGDWLTGLFGKKDDFDFLL
jgi:hypothetical protein